MAGNVYSDLNDYMDYLARRFPGQFGQSPELGLLNAQPQRPGSPALPMAPPTTVAPPVQPPAQLPPSPDPEPIASGTSVGAPGAADSGQSPLLKLGQQLMGQAGQQKPQGIPFPDAAKLSPFTGNPLHPLPFNLPRFGGY